MSDDDVTTEKRRDDGDDALSEERAELVLEWRNREW